MVIHVFASRRFFPVNVDRNPAARRENSAEVAKGGLCVPSVMEYFLAVDKVEYPQPGQRLPQISAAICDVFELCRIAPRRSEINQIDSNNIRIRCQRSEQSGRTSVSASRVENARDTLKPTRGVTEAPITVSLENPLLKRRIRIKSVRKKCRRIFRPLIRERSMSLDIAGRAARPLPACSARLTNSHDQRSSLRSIPASVRSRFCQ